MELYIYARVALVSAGSLESSNDETLDYCDLTLLLNPTLLPPPFNSAPRAHNKQLQINIADKPVLYVCVRVCEWGAFRHGNRDAAGLPHAKREQNG